MRKEEKEEIPSTDESSSLNFAAALLHGHKHSALGFSGKQSFLL